MPLKKVIINADDFGLSASVNEAVADAAGRGVLSSASMMANMPGFEDAIKIAKEHPKLGLGVHLNILRGKPLLEGRDVSNIVGSSGNFKFSAAALFVMALSGRLPLDQIESELSAQVSRVVNFGIFPTHLDSERHMHVLLPPLWDVVARIASNFGIAAVRVVRENVNLVPKHKFPSKQKLKAVLVNRFSRGLANVVEKYSLKHTDGFFGIAATGSLNEGVYENLFAALPAGTTEIMCHPAIRAGAAIESDEKSWLDEARVAEYRALVSERTIRALKNSRVKLISYGDL